MAEKEVKNLVTKPAESENAENCFLDKTDKQWYISKKEKKVTLCGSIDDIIGGNGESFEFSRMVVSSRNSAKGIKNNFVVFYLSNGSILLLKRWNEMK